METYDYQADLCRTGLYETSRQIREIHSAYGTPVQKGKCYGWSKYVVLFVFMLIVNLASGTWCDRPIAYYQCEEESPKPYVYTVR